MTAPTPYTRMNNGAARHRSAPRRVAITGIGCVTPIGTGAEALWRGLRAERSAVTSITRFDS
jgi:acyl transferase domain-containing protein